MESRNRVAGLALVYLEKLGVIDEMNAFPIPAWTRLDKKRLNGKMDPNATCDFRAVGALKTLAFLKQGHENATKLRWRCEEHLEAAKQAYAKSLDTLGKIPEGEDHSAEAEKSLQCLIKCRTAKDNFENCCEGAANATACWYQAYYMYSVSGEEALLTFTDVMIG